MTLPLGVTAGAIVGAAAGAAAVVEVVAAAAGLADVGAAAAVGAGAGAAVAAAGGAGGVLHAAIKPLAAPPASSSPPSLSSRRRLTGASVSTSPLMLGPPLSSAFVGQTVPGVRGRCLDQSAQRAGSYRVAHARSMVD